MGNCVSHDTVAMSPPHLLRPQFFHETEAQADLMGTFNSLPAENEKNETKAH